MMMADEWDALFPRSWNVANARDWWNGGNRLRRRKRKHSRIGPIGGSRFLGLVTTWQRLWWWGLRQERMAQIAPVGCSLGILQAIFCIPLYIEPVSPISLFQHH